ncbi:MAG: hypothetical protein IPK44_00865 [Candidatus Accumulibacter sp.]|uniref:hypothetical protein n=1 Tax=Accumulibacter sp. TaxID=2053492 RepID=UPI0025899BF4|nr:hypothetical protein [Accumulibacter sp.]MBK8113148.1 hypothetical protein [Accumulibacter sp.]
MARTASIILTKEDKKAKLAELNESIKAAKLEIKVNGAAVKENDNALKAATKEHAVEAKRLTKEADALAKKLATFEAQKSALVNDTSVAPSAARPSRRPRRRRQAHPSYQGGNGSRPRRRCVSIPPRLPGLTRKPPRLHKEG